MTKLAFLDLETTGLSLDDDIWEFAAIVREEDGTETTCHMFIQHDYLKCAKLPEPFRSDHQARFAPGALAEPQEAAAKRIAALLADRIHIVGAVPNFDTERIALLLRRFGLTPGWHYHLCCVENLVVGYLAAQGEALAPPWSSDDLSTRMGVDVEKYDRHTALGDAKWARDLYDAVMSAGGR